MEVKQRNRYTKEFKLQVVRLLKDEQRTVLQVSKDTEHRFNFNLSIF
jgi:transposase-like protein